MRDISGLFAFGLFFLLLAISAGALTVLVAFFVGAFFTFLAASFGAFASLVAFAFGAFLVFASSFVAVFYVVGSGGCFSCFSFLAAARSECESSYESYRVKYFFHLSCD